MAAVVVGCLIGMTLSGIMAAIGTLFWTIGDAIEKRASCFMRSKFTELGDYIFKIVAPILFLVSCITLLSILIGYGISEAIKWRIMF